MQKILQQLKENKNSSKSNIIYIGSPLHGNIGDQAIAIATMEYLKANFDNEIIEIYAKQYIDFKEEIKQYIKQEDVIVLMGGGHIGTLWMVEEERVRGIITDYPKNKIVIMPQTIFFENSVEGNQELETTKNIFNKHKNLHIFVREQQSYDLCKNKLIEDMQKVYLVPDIVFYLTQLDKYKNISRDDNEKIILCFRSDKEKVMTSLQNEKILEEVEKTKLKVLITDTVIYQDINKDERDKIVENKIKEFRNAKLVITDRLHGMIFAIIAGTPCIALNNISKKVEAVYKWVENNDSVMCIESIENIENEIKEKLDLKEQSFEMNFITLLDKIIEVIKNKS